MQNLIPFPGPDNLLHQCLSIRLFRQVIKAEKKPAPVYKVQLFASNTKLKANAGDFKGLKDADFFVEGGLYKYTLGAETDYSKIVIVRKQVVSKFPGAFIIAFVGDKKMTVNEALKLNK